MRPKFKYMCYSYPTLAGFPDPGAEEALYLAEDTGAAYRCAGGEYIPLRGTDAATQPVLMTQAEYDALEDPPGSGEYPSLKGKSVVITDGDEAEFNYFAVPDYANIETVNRISANGGTWTADRSGYVKVYCSFANTNNNGGSDLWFVNNVGIAGSMRFQDTGQMEFTSVVKVAKGDVVMFSVNSNWTVALVKCFFIPPKFIKQAPPVVVDEPNGSYSLDEVKTAETWIDGKPIYKRTFTGTGPTSVGTFINDLLIPPGTIDTLTRSEPVYSAGGYDFVDKILVDNTTGAIVGTMRTMKHSNTGIQFGIWLASGVNALYAGGVYKVTVWYTKTTD
jgi:hypothetical protein